MPGPATPSPQVRLRVGILGAGMIATVSPATCPACGGCAAGWR